jgi:hypothetical protein
VNIVTSQKTEIFFISAVRKSNHASVCFISLHLTSNRTVLFFKMCTRCKLLVYCVGQCWQLLGNIAWRMISPVLHTGYVRSYSLLCLFVWFTGLTDFRCNAQIVVDTIINIRGISKWVFFTIKILHSYLKYFSWWIHDTVPLQKMRYLYFLWAIFLLNQLRVQVYHALNKLIISLRLLILMVGPRVL